MTDGVKEALHVRGVLVFLMPILGSPSVRVFEDSIGRVELAKHTHWVRPAVSTSTYGTNSRASW